jgi:hypothetical protein
MGIPMQSQWDGGHVIGETSNQILYANATTKINMLNEGTRMELDPSSTCKAQIKTLAKRTFD